MEYRFSDCTLDTERHELCRAGVPCHVEPQVFALLRLLAERAGAVVTRDEIVDRVWQGRIVSEASISARISAARTAVGDTGAAQGIIRTVTRVGLQLVVPVETSGPQAPTPRTAAGSVAMTTSRDGTGIAWSQSGDGFPLLRAGHWMTHLELDWDSPVWSAWLDRLGRGRRLVRYDLRGTGMSDRTDAALTLDLLADDLEAVADAAGLDRFDVFAASQAVPTAVAFAARNPDRVRRMIFYGGFAQGNAVRDGAAGAAMITAMGEMIRKGWGGPQVGGLRSFSALFMPDAGAEEVQSFMDLQVASASAERAVAIRSFFAEVDIMELLPGITAPVLVIHAVNDALQPFAEAQKLARLLPRATFVRLDSVNHILVPSEPAFGRLMDSVDDFLS